MKKLISLYIKYTLMPFSLLSKTHAFLNSKKINIGKSEIRLSVIAYLIIGIVFFNALLSEKSENNNNGPCISNEILCSSWTSTYSHGSYNGSEITQDTEIIFYDDSTFTANLFNMDAEGVAKEQSGTWSMECVEKKDNTYKNGEIVNSKTSYENQITCIGEAPYYRKTLIYGIYQKTKSKWVLNIAMNHDFLFAGVHGLFNRQSKSPSRLNNSSISSLNKTSNNQDNNQKKQITIKETAIEETVIEETAIEETVIEETVIEETVIEETDIEEYEIFFQSTHLVEDPDGWTNFRETPKGKIITKLNNKTKCKFLDNNNGWFYIELEDGKKGYVYNTGLKTID